MNVRKAIISDLRQISEIYADARRFMKDTGNGTQWGSVYPPVSLTEEDIRCERLYVVEDKEALLAAFVFFVGNDPTYDKIYDGEWKNSLPYGVIHRVCVSSSARGKGVARQIFDYCAEIAGNLRIDTHKNNIPMQRALAKFGFEYCGIIKLEGGDERLSYQFTKG